MEDFNKIAIESIKSVDVKNYVMSKGHKFSTSEQVSLIFNSDIKLVEKKKVFDSMLLDENIPEEIKSEIEVIIDNINTFYEYIDGKSDIAFQFSDEDECYVTSQFESVIYYCCKNNIRDYIRIIDLKEKTIDLNEMYEFSIDEDGDIVRFVPINEPSYRYTEIEDAYVDIPNEFKLGDIVKIVGSKEKYVVVSDSSMPEHLKPNCNFVDSSITIIPKRCLSSKGKDYVEQINDIYRKRIRDIEYAKPIIDVISREHSHVCITMVERVSI